MVYQSLTFQKHASASGLSSNGNPNLRLIRNWYGGFSKWGIRLHIAWCDTQIGVSYFCTSPRRDWEWLGCSDRWKQSSQCRVGCFYLRDLFKQSPIPSVVSSRRGIRVHFFGEKRWTRVESARQWLHPRSKPWFLVVNFHTIGTIQVVFIRGMGWLEGLIPRITRNLCLVLGFDPYPIHDGE